MRKASEKTYVDFVLPMTVVSRVDVSHLVRELERADDELTSRAVRGKAGAKQLQQPVWSSQLTDFLDQNELSLETGQARSRLIKQLRLLKDKVPVIHMTFPGPADYKSLQKLAEWFRKSVHPQAVIEVGLQPGLVGGVYVRTPNHVLDLSLRARLEEKGGTLVKELEAARGAK